MDREYEKLLKSLIIDMNRWAKQHSDEYNFSDIADAAELHRNTVNRILNGTTKNPHLKTVFKIAWSMGYEISLTKRRKLVKAA